MNLLRGVRALRSCAASSVKSRGRSGRAFRPATSVLEGRSLPATFIVTNTSGSAAVEGSLPWAVEQANDRSPGLDRIEFNVPGDGARMIDLTSPLDLDEQTVVDASTQQGYFDAAAPVVTLHGGGTVGSIFRLRQNSSGSTIQGLAMVGFTAGAVTILNESQGNWIQDNDIGFAYDSAGRLHLNRESTGEFAIGVSILSSMNTIRGNTISGVYHGITVGENILGTWSGTVYRTNSIERNQIGTDPTGSTAEGFGNQSNGVHLAAGARENFLGPANVLSGNGWAGVTLLDPTNRGNVVFANRIGLDRGGMAAVPNGGFGVILAGGAFHNAIGGPFGGNVISANPAGGILVGASATAAARENWVHDNVVGLDASQTAVVGRQNMGIIVEQGATLNSIRGNVVAGNQINGFQLSMATGNFVSYNWIGRSYTGTGFANQAFGVVLINGSRQNWLWHNAFGPAGLGRLYADADSTGNDIID